MAVRKCDRKRASKGEAQNAKKSRSVVAKDKELDDLVAICDMDEGKGEITIAEVSSKKKAASKGRVVRGKEVWILRVALGNDAVWVRYASMQEAAEAVKEASNCRHTSIRKIVAKKLNEIPADIGGRERECAAASRRA